MDYLVNYKRMRDDKILCEVIPVDERKIPRPPSVAKGIGDTKDQARNAALASTTDPDIQRLLVAPA